MKKKLSPAMVGAFVAGFAVLFVIALVSFGSSGLFRHGARFVVIMRQTSVSGLDPGASVKISGVRVGRVESIVARFDPEANEVLVRIVCDINSETAAALFPPPEPTRADVMPELVARGLGAKLAYAGITGLLFVDLIVVPENKGQPVRHDEELGLTIVPAVPSKLSEFAETLSTIADNLSRIDYAGISEELHAVLGNLNGVLKDLKLQATVDRVGLAAESLREFAQDPTVRSSLERLSESMKELRAMLADMRTSMPALQADLQDTLTEAADAMKSMAATTTQLNALLGPRGGLTDEIGRTLESLRRTAEGVEQLVDYLERNPGALLRGRSETDVRSTEERR